MWFCLTTTEDKNNDKWYEGYFFYQFTFYLFTLSVSSILYKKCIQIGGFQKNVFLTQHIDVKILLRGACNINRFAGVSSRIFWSGSKEL